MPNGNWWVGEMPASVPPLEQPGFEIPAHLLDVKPSVTGEAVVSAVLGPFKTLVEENIGLLLGVVGLGICVLVGSFVIKYVAGQGGPRNPHLTAYERASWTEQEGVSAQDWGMGDGPGA